MPSTGDKGVMAFGTNYVFHKVSYNGTSTTFTVDQSATVASCVSPASGPTPSLGSASSTTFLKTVTLAAAGANEGGNVIICTTHGKSVASSKP